MRLCLRIITGSVAVALGLFTCLVPAQAQIVVNTGLSPAQLVQTVLVGSGVSVTNITYGGGAGSIGQFTGGAGSNLGLPSGIVISTGQVNGTPAIGSPAVNFADDANGTGSDPQLAALASGVINDASVLQFDFRPISDTIKFRYVFASEEYPEFVGSIFNDIFGFFVTGPNPAGGSYTNFNIAIIPGTVSPVTINNVNSGSYSQYYVNNGSGATVVYDGFTTVLTAWCLVTPCSDYHIKIAIGDVGDDAYDSGVFLEANSFSSNGLSYNTTYSSDIDTVAVEGCNDALISFILGDIAADTVVIHYSVGGTAAEGPDYPAIPDSLVILPGMDSVGFVIHPISDSTNETTETVIISYINTVCGTLDTILILIKDYDPIVTTLTPDVLACNGAAANLTVTGAGGYPPLTYEWSTGETTTTIVTDPATPTMFYVSVADECNFASVDSVLVSISNLSTQITGIDSVSCNNYTDGGLTVTQSGGLPDFDYLWTTTDTTASISGLSSGNYTVTVTDAIGCTSSSNITLLNPPAMEIQLLPTDESCLNSCNGQVICDIIANPYPPYTYAWNTSPAQNGATATNLCAGEYTLTMSYSPNNCPVSATVNVGTNTLIDAHFTADPLQGYVPFDVNFVYNGTGAMNYAWDFGDGTGSSTAVNPTYTYTTMGVFSVVLTVTSGPPDNCVATFLVPVTAIQPSSMTFPNVFTPNSDGRNDYFSVQSEGIRSFNTIIYNRWGKKVHETGIGEGFSAEMAKTELWNGKNMHGGADCAAGTYFFVIEAVGYDSKEYTFNGTIELLR